MILLDTSVLVYAIGSDHALRAPCQGLLRLVAEGYVRATTTVEAVQEFTHVRARRRTRAEAAARAHSVVRGLGPLARPDDDDLSEALDLFERSPKLGAFDAVLAATARRRGWALASADRAFSGVDDLTHLNPLVSSFLDEARRLGSS